MQWESQPMTIQYRQPGSHGTGKYSFHFDDVSFPNLAKQGGSLWEQGSGNDFDFDWDDDLALIYNKPDGNGFTIYEDGEEITSKIYDIGTGNGTDGEVITDVQDAQGNPTGLLSVKGRNWCRKDGTLWQWADTGADPPEETDQESGIIAEGEVISDNPEIYGPKAENGFCLYLNGKEITETIIELRDDSQYERDRGKIITKYNPWCSKDGREYTYAPEEITNYGKEHGFTIRDAYGNDICAKESKKYMTVEGEYHYPLTPLIKDLSGYNYNSVSVPKNHVYIDPVSGRFKFYWDETPIYTQNIDNGNYDEINVTGLVNTPQISDPRGPYIETPISSGLNEYQDLLHYLQIFEMPISALVSRLEVFNVNGSDLPIWITAFNGANPVLENTTYKPSIELEFERINLEGSPPDVICVNFSAWQASVIEYNAWIGSLLGNIEIFSSGSAAETVFIAGQPDDVQDSWNYYNIKHLPLFKAGESYAIEYPTKPSPDSPTPVGTPSTSSLDLTINEDDGICADFYYYSYRTDNFGYSVKIRYIDPEEPEYANDAWTYKIENSGSLESLLTDYCWDELDCEYSWDYVGPHPGVSGNNGWSQETPDVPPLMPFPSLNPIARPSRYPLSRRLPLPYPIPDPIDTLPDYWTSLVAPSCWRSYIDDVGPPPDPFPLSYHPRSTAYNSFPVRHFYKWHQPNLLRLMFNLYGYSFECRILVPTRKIAEFLPENLSGYLKKIELKIKSGIGAFRASIIEYNPPFTGTYIILDSVICGTSHKDSNGIIDIDFENIPFLSSDKHYGLLLTHLGGDKIIFAYKQDTDTIGGSSSAYTSDWEQITGKLWMKIFIRESENPKNPLLISYNSKPINDIIVSDLSSGINNSMMQNSDKKAIIDPINNLIFLNKNDIVQPSLIRIPFSSIDSANSIIVNSDDGTAWFCEPATGRIGKISSDCQEILGEITLEQGVSSISASPYDGTCWFIDASRNKVGKLSPDCKEIIGEMTIPQGVSSISVSSFDGACWYINGSRNIIRKISQDCQYFIGIIIDSYDFIYSIATDPTDGSCWVGDTGSGKIGKIDINCSTYPVEIALWVTYPIISINMKNGECWVADEIYHKVYKINADCTGILGIVDFKEEGDYAYAKSISVNPNDGTCLIFGIRIEPDYEPRGYIWKINRYGNQISGKASLYDLKQNLNWAELELVSLNPADGTYWVAAKLWIGGFQEFNVLKISSDLQMVLGEISGFNRPSSISVDPNDGTCWVADGGITRISDIVDIHTPLDEIGVFNFDYNYKKYPDGVIAKNLEDGPPESDWESDFIDADINKIYIDPVSGRFRFHNDNLPEGRLTVSYNFNADSSDPRGFAYGELGIDPVNGRALFHPEDVPLFSSDETMTGLFYYKDYEGERPLPPVVLNAVERISDTPFILIGSKQENTSVWLEWNGKKIEIVEPDSETDWTYEIYLNNGANELNFTSKKHELESDVNAYSINYAVKLPTIDNESPVSSPSIILNGRKGRNTSIQLLHAVEGSDNFEEIVPISESQIWSYDWSNDYGQLNVGNNIFAIQSSDSIGNISEIVNKTIVHSTDLIGADEIDYEYFADAGDGDNIENDLKVNLVSVMGIEIPGDLSLNNPPSVKFDQNGNMYIVDYGNLCIKKINSKGIYEGWFGTDNNGETCWHEPDSGLIPVSGSGQGELYYPMDLAFDDDGNVYIMDIGTQHIKKFDADWNFITEWPVSAGFRI